MKVISQSQDIAEQQAARERQTDGEKERDREIQIRIETGIGQETETAITSGCSFYLPADKIYASITKIGVFL